MAKQNLLTDASVAIMGLGLMGGSIAMALRGKCARIIGVDPDPMKGQRRRRRRRTGWRLSGPLAMFEHIRDSRQFTAISR